MRQWIRRYPRLAVAIVLLAEWMVLAAVFRVFGRPLLDAVVESVLWTAVSGIVWLFDWRRMRRTATCLEDNGQILSYVRYPDSRPGSLSGIWNMGLATPRHGWIDFQPAVYDTLEPSGRPTTIQVVDVLPERRQISGKERRYISGLGIQAMTLMTEKGKVEIAASPDSLKKLVDAVQGRQ